MRKILYFSSSWCSPCVGFAPIMNEVSTQIRVDKVDVDKNINLVEKYHIKNIPTCVLVEGDKEISRFVGTRSKIAVLEFIKSN